MSTVNQPIGPTKMVTSQHGQRYIASFLCDATSAKLYLLNFFASVDSLLGTTNAVLESAAQREAGTDVSDNTTKLFIVTVVAMDKNYFSGVHATSSGE